MWPLVIFTGDATFAGIVVAALTYVAMLRKEEIR